MAKRGTCSFSTVSERTGKDISGISAMLQTMRLAGGPDAYLENLAEDVGARVGRSVAKAILQEQRDAQMSGPSKSKTGAKAKAPTE